MSTTAFRIVAPTRGRPALQPPPKTEGPTSDSSDPSPRTAPATTETDTAARRGPSGGLARDDGPTSDSKPRPVHPVILVHRIGSALAAAVLSVFGATGLAGGLAFFSTQGRPVLGLSSNGLLSTVSIATAIVLLAAAVRGGRSASTISIVIGGMFLVSAFVNLALLGTTLNILAFRLPNVFFSLGAGLLLLLLGAYGRVSGALPDDNPYRRQDSTQAVALPRQPRPATAAEAAADRAMAAAEVAVAQGTATPQQTRAVEAIAKLRTHEERRRAWIAHRSSTTDSR